MSAPWPVIPYSPLSWMKLPKMCDRSSTLTPTTWFSRTSLFEIDQSSPLMSMPSPCIFCTVRPEIVTFGHFDEMPSGAYACSTRWPAGFEPSVIVSLS